MSNIGERLKLERERLGLTQTALGEIGGVKKLAQINYENNSRSPDANYLTEIAKFGADIHFIITGIKQENVASTLTELEFIRICRSIHDEATRKLALRVLIAISENK